MTSGEALYLCLVLITFGGFAAILVLVARYHHGAEQFREQPADGHTHASGVLTGAQAEP